MAFWSVVQTISGHEAAVARRIEEREGVETLTPKARIRVNGKLKIAALFPGYLFAHIVAGWYEVRWTVGVLRVVLAGDHPAHMPDDLIEKIQQEMGRTGLVKIPKAPPKPTHNALVIGQQVKILTGSFRGFTALYEGMSARDRETVLLDLLGRKVPIELSDDDRIVALPLASEPQMRY